MDKFIKNELTKTYLKKKKILLVSENLFQINKSYDFKIINSGYYFLNNHLNIISNHININRVRIEELNISSGYLSTVNLLTTLSIKDPINSIRIMNESVEDNLNNIIREIVNNSFHSSNSFVESTTNKFKADLILLRDEYKKYLPPEVIIQEISNEALHLSIYKRIKKELYNLNPTIISSLL